MAVTNMQGQTESFMIYGFKIIQCGQSAPHDWSTCPLAHANEKARRRDPRIHDYLPDICQARARKMDCAYGDSCPYAHNVYESWLHPLRYRTQLCRYGMSCMRPLCFFAHSTEEFREPQLASALWQQQRLQQGFPQQVPAPPQPALPPAPGLAQAAAAAGIGSLRQHFLQTPGGGMAILGAGAGLGSGGISHGMVFLSQAPGQQPYQQVELLMQQHPANTLMAAHPGALQLFQPAPAAASIQAAPPPAPAPAPPAQQQLYFNGGGGGGAQGTQQPVMMMVMPQASSASPAHAAGQQVPSYIHAQTQQTQQTQAQTQAQAACGPGPLAYGSACAYDDQSPGAGAGALAYESWPPSSQPGLSLASAGDLAASLRALSLDGAGAAAGGGRGAGGGGAGSRGGGGGGAARQGRRASGAASAECAEGAQ